MQGLDGKLETTRAALDEARREGNRARDRLGLPFEQASRLDELRRRQREINDALTATDPTSPAPEVDAARMLRELDTVAAAAPSGLSR